MADDNILTIGIIARGEGGGAISSLTINRVVIKLDPVHAIAAANTNRDT